MKERGERVRASRRGALYSADGKSNLYEFLAKKLRVCGARGLYYCKCENIFNHNFSKFYSTSAVKVFISLLHSVYHTYSIIIRFAFRPRPSPLFLLLLPRVLRAESHVHNEYIDPSEERQFSSTLIIEKLNASRVSFSVPLIEII